MKPVPILQYLDHIGRAAQADPQSSRPDPSPFKPRALRALQDPLPRSPLIFSRALRDAATGGRAQMVEGRLERTALDGRSSNREAAPQHEASPAPDVEARIAEAYERGLRDGSAAARAEDVEALAREQAGQREKAAVERLAFQQNECAQLANMIATGLAEIEERIAGSVARVLAPFLTSEMSKQVIDELCDNIARLHAGGAPGLIKIRGPEALLAVLRERATQLSVDVEFVEREGVEVTIQARHTTITSQLQPWADLIASLV